MGGGGKGATTVAAVSDDGIELQEIHQSGEEQTVTLTAPTFNYSMF